jgi:flagellar motor protein MotB
MYKRVNIWPAFADLFSSLLIFTLGGIMVSSIGVMKFTRPKREAEKILNAVKTKLESKLEKGLLKDTPESVVIEIRINFEPDSDEITKEEDKKKLKIICEALLETWEEFKKENKIYPNVIVRIEGHTDSILPKNAPDEKTGFLYNWNLSAQRATSIVYEFKKACGIDPSTYPIEVVGFGSFRPIKNPEKSKEDREINRRIEIKIIPDYSKISF